MSEGVGLCLAGSRDSVLQDAKRGTVVVHEETGVAEKYVKLVEDVYEGSKTVVNCVVGLTDGVKVGVILHQGVALNPISHFGE